MCTSFKNRCVAVILAAVLLFSTLPFGSFRVFAEGAGQLSTDIGTKTFRVGASEEFTFTTTAGDDAGTMVKGRFTFSDPDALETLEYLESKNGEWYEFSGDFGPETGFPLIDGTSRFRATFQKAGTYTVSAQMVRVDDDSVVCQTEAQVQVVYVNGTLTTDLSEKTFKLHEATEFTFTTTAGDDAGTMVKGRFTFNDQAALEKLEYLESKNGEWYEFSGDFGPETGFPLIDGTSRFRATFQKAGTYTVSAQMVRVDDDSVVCETTASINVAWNAAQLKTDIDKKNLVYGQKTEYTYTTVAGDDAGTMVKGRFTFSDPSALETLEYYEVMDGKWYPLNGEFGPSAGFPLSDATSRFRATFKKAGTFTCTVEIYSVEDQTVLCKDTTKITVQKAELTGISVVGTNNNYDGNEFELVKITGCEQGDKVSYWVNGEEETDTPPKRSAIGSYEVRVVVTRDENHASYEATVASMIWGTIDPGSGLIVQGTYCIYDGKPHDVVTVTRADGEGDYTLKYRMEGEGEDDWRTEIPQVTDAGSYTVYVKATKGNYNDLKVEVKPAEGAEYPFNVCIAQAEQNLVFADGETIEKTWSEDSESNKYTNAVSGGKTEEEVKYSAVADEMSNGLPCAEINEETGEVTFYGAGTVQVTAIKKGDNNYKDAEISYTLTIRRAAQAELRIESSISSEFTYNENGNKIKLSTTGGSGDGAVTYGIQAIPADCVELEGDTLTVRKSGVVQVTATKEKTDTYEAAQSEAKEIAIQKATQSIAFEATPETVIYGTAYKNVAEPVEVSQAADRKGYAENTGITYKVIEGEKIASVEKDGSLSWKGGSVGKLTVQAIKAGDDCYKEASAEYTVTVAYAQLPETPYTIEGTRAEGSQGDWYIGDVTITPAEGYSIGETNLTDESKWSTGLVITEEGTTEKTIYLRNNEDLGITDEITISNIRIDKTAPTDLQISYKTSLLDTILSVGSIGFYDAPVEVTVSASDDVAPVCEFVITYGDEQKIVKKGDAGFSEGKNASATITINPQFRGKVSFTAINEAGLRAASDQEKEPTIVVDNIAPNVTVKYDNYEVENGSYYKTDRTATIQIAEENFFPEAMTEKRSDDTTYLKIAVTRVDDNGKETTTNYTDETLTFTKKGNVWEAELSFTENGDYTLVVDYMDFSNNYDGKESHYETSFTIDKTDPVIVVTHENNDAVNGSYFKADRPVKVEITEHNFDPAKVDLTVTASNANGEVADFAAYLKDPNNWKTEGDKHTAEFTFETEASYTFDISVTDLAGRSNQDVSYGNTVAPTAFTIDKTAPTDLQISYKTSLLDTILSVGSIGFYDAPVEVTVSASDDVAPVCEFVITYGDEQKIVKKGDAGFSEGKNASATITINPQFRGKVFFTAINEAGLRAASDQEKEPTIVVDNIAPNVTVKYDNYEVENGSYYKTDRTATIQIAEENFFSEAMTEKRSDDATYLKIAVTRVDDNGKETTTNYTDETLTFTKKGNVWEAELSFTENGDYTFVVDYMDFSNNYDGKESHYETSFTIDKEPPKISVTPNKQCLADDFSAELQIIEHNFNAADVELTEENDSLKNYADYIKDEKNWKSDGNTHTLKLSIDEEAHYIGKVVYRDKAGNPQECEVDFALDKTAPTDLQISYKTSPLDTILSVGSIGFYDAPVEVTVSASDDVAPVCEFVITYGDEQKTVKKGDAGFSEGKTASATITINPQFRGKVSFTAINEAGLRAASDQEKEPTIVVDNIAPNVTVKYDNYEVENGSYYKTDRTATIQIAEENFFSEAMTEKRSDDAPYLKIAVTRVDDNGKETTTNYTDETLTFTKKGNVWEAGLSFTENGDYTFVVDYMDFSNNYDGKESHYETSFTIDKTDPVIVVTHENNDAVNGSYFKADRPVTVEITEHNFDPAKVALTVTASNANGEVADFAAYLKNPDSWRTEGDKHTAEFPFETEASYTFDISVTDLAGRSNQDVSYGESVAPTAFTIDKTAPVIVVTHENNDAANGSYFKADRPVKVEITERNFDPAKVDLTVTASNANGEVADFAAYLKKADSWKKDGNRYTAEFPFETEASYTFDISVTDLAGRSNQDVSYGESVAPTAFTIDKTDPVIKVTHSNNSAKNGSYFKADRPVKVEITERNFDPAKVDLMVTARNATGAVTDFAAYLKNPDSWRTEGDKHTAEFPFETEASYTFDISVTDLAGRSNQDVSYGESVAPTAFTIDKTDPVIKVTHSNNSAKNGSYFKADRPVKVEITERNFDPAKVDLMVTARNATGAVTDFAAYLKNPNNWKTEGDKHTAEFTFETEADYTFDISVTDLAGRSNQDVSYVESVAPKAFTIDKTAPTDGEITIDGQSVRAENSLAFEKFYREAQSIKFTAKFDISGKHSIEYQKVTSLSAAPEEGKWLPYTNSVAAQPNERFVIYFRAEDQAGNVSVFRSTGIVVDDQAPVGEKNAPEIDILPQAGNENGIHTADVAVSLRVVDPKYLGTTANEKNGYYSGLKEITYRIYAQDTGAEETGTLLCMGEKTVGDVTAENGLVSAWSGSINVSAGKFNSNYVFVEVTAVDNAGNKRITTVDSPIRIDTTAPRISVSYDNNNGDATFANGSTDAFFKEGRTATIVVTERNFDPALVALTLTNRTGATPVLSGWRTEQGSGNGDDTRHIATLYYGTDGEYNFGISCKDLAGLSSTAVSYQGLAPQRFTIDRTAPVISVVYDNMDAKNENHYKASRTATITITERNFEQSRLTIRLTATDHGEAIKAPEISAWSSSGDTHTATIRYDADALYSFDISYRDKAGNAADRYRGDTFYVDQTLPKVTLSGIADESANSEKGDIGFVLTATDTNLDEFTPVITAVLMEDGQIVKRELAVGESKPIEDGMEFVVKNLPDDGIYRITCTVTDKAGNAFEEITLYRKDGTAYTAKRTGADDLLTFSVNRSGSVYEMTSYTAALTEKYYVQRVTEEVAIVEINADPLISYVVTLGGKELQEGTDYTVSIEGGSGDWRKYTYHVQSTLFDAEGEYNLVISSVDGAENDAFSDVKGASIHFVVDRTAPVVAVSGLAAGGRYQTTKQQVTLIPTDDGGALKSLRVLLVDDDGETLEELVNLQGEALEKALEENDGKITFELSEGLYQNVRIICDDCADYGDKENIIYDKVFRNVSVSSSAFMIFWANKPLRWGVIGGVSAVVLAALLVLLLKKRKKKD